MLEANKQSIYEITNDLNRSLDDDIRTTKERIESFIQNADKNDRLKIGFREFSRVELIAEQRKENFLTFCAVSGIIGLSVNTLVTVNNNIGEYYNLLKKINELNKKKAELNIDFNEKTVKIFDLIKSGILGNSELKEYLELSKIEIELKEQALSSDLLLNSDIIIEEPATNCCFLSGLLDHCIISKIFDKK